MRNIIFFFLSLLMIHHIDAQQQITDFIYKDGDRSSKPGDFVEFDGSIYFEATTENFGREIWISNGQENEASLLKDINPGKNHGANYFLKNTSVIFNNTLFFVANDGTSEGEIWKTDGTKVGTEKVTNFLNYRISRLTLVDDHFYFLIIKGGLLQVWRSNGTVNGTKLVKGNLPIWNSPSFQGKCNNMFIFTFQTEGSNLPRVWRSDGTSTGTFAITDELKGNGAGYESGHGGSSLLSQYIEYNEELYFMSYSSLYKIDKNVETTNIIDTLYDASNGFLEFADAIEINGKLYFSFYDFDKYRLLIWESDGTKSGKKKLYDVTNDRKFLTSNLSSKDNNLLFCGANQTGGTSLIKINLEDYTTAYVKELQDSIKNDFFMRTRGFCMIRNIGNEKYFISVPDKYPYSKGWISYLTETNTSSIEVLNDVREMITHNSFFYFSKETENVGAELWKSDGTESNTFLLDNINTGPYSAILSDMMAYNNDLIFSAYNGYSDYSSEPWIYSNTSNFLKNIWPGTSSTGSSNFTLFDNEVFFIANDSNKVRQIWKSNGTKEGTQIAINLMDFIIYPDDGFLVVYNENLFFYAYKNGHYYLCRKNGANVQIIKDFGENNRGNALSVKEIFSSDDYIYFINKGNDLWISDGTGDGTFMLKDLSICEKLTCANGKIYFVAAEVYLGNVGIWSSEGTVKSTTVVKNIGYYSLVPDDLIAFDNSLYFTAFTNDNGREVWKSDGTEDGTKLFIDINPGVESSIINSNFCVLNNELFFVANDGETGFELWKTNGTVSGTSIVKDINSGFESSFPSQITKIQDILYFQAYDVKHGVELWKSDGTKEGTKLVADILYGDYSSSPTNILGISDNVFFIAETVNDGPQIWKIKYNTVSAVSDLDTEPELFLYPNPCVDFIHINTNTSIDEIRVYNSQGQLIKIEKINNSINVSNFPSGLYLVKFEVSGKKIVEKIIKE